MLEEGWAKIPWYVDKEGNLACQVPKLWIKGITAQGQKHSAMWAIETCEKIMLKSIEGLEEQLQLASAKEKEVATQKKAEDK